MQIEYVATRSKRTVSDAIGEVLIERKIARRVESRPDAGRMLVKAIGEQLAAKVDRGIMGGAEEVSPPAEKPKRKRRYKRKDMQAEGIEE